MSTSSLRLFFALALLSAATGSAQEAARPARRNRNAPAAEEAAPPAAPPPYELKKKSSFATLPDTARVPFWPIGWVKRRVGVIAEVATAAPAPKFELDEKSFKVSSILVGNPSLAIVNGRTYMEGEFLRMPRAAGSGAPTVATSTVPANARVRVFRINDGSVVLQHLQSYLTISLQRPELAQKAGREELLQEDRP